MFHLIMSELVFYQITSSGESEIVEVDNKSFHSRSSIIIHDQLNKKIIVANGSSTPKKTLFETQKFVKFLNSKNGFQLKIKEIDAERDGRIIANLLTAQNQINGDVANSALNNTHLQSSKSHGSSQVITSSTEIFAFFRQLNQELEQFSRAATDLNATRLNIMALVDDILSKVSSSSLG